MVLIIKSIKMVSFLGKNTGSEINLNGFLKVKNICHALAVIIIRNVKICDMKVINLNKVNYVI